MGIFHNVKFDNLFFRQKSFVSTLIIYINYLFQIES